MKTLYSYVMGYCNTKLINIVMNFQEQKWLQDCPPEIKPKYYRRYVDDIFVLCNSSEQLEKLKEYLNSKHPNINSTSLLDMIIDRNSNKIVTSIYRKTTFTGVYTHFYSFLPSVYKFGLLSTLLFTYFSLCSNFQLFHLEVLEFKKHLFTKWLSSQMC